MFVTDIGCFEIGWVGIRNEAQLGSAMFELPELVICPSRTKTSDRVLNTDLMQTEHIRRTLHQVHHICTDGRACSHVHSKDCGVLVKERCVGIIDILGCIIALFGFDSASGKGYVSSGALADRNHDPSAEDIDEVVILGVLGQEQFGRDTFGIGVVDKGIILIGSIADTVLLKEILIPAIGGLFQGFLRFFAVIP